jgi:hypothetical protein
VSLFEQVIESDLPVIVAVKTSWWQEEEDLHYPDSPLV